MIETAGEALATFFATIGPLDISAFFAALTVGLGARAKFIMAARGTLVATVILLSFALFGEVHGVTLAFGATLIGVSDDYTIHFLQHHILSPSPHGPRGSLEAVWRGVVLGGVALARL